MKVSLTCKLDSNGAYGFIKPISNIKNVSSIDVFRDSKSLPCKKVKSHTSFKNKNGVFGQLSKLLKMVKTVNSSYKLSIGIYEIPHGLLAFLIGKLKNVPIVISIIGNLGYTNLRKELINQSLIYVLTSKGEGFPLALLETMACGLVPIVTNVGDISDVIIDKENGFILENPQDYKKLSKTIEYLLLDKALYATMADKVLKIRDMCSFEAATRKWEKIINNIGVK